MNSSGSPSAQTDSPDQTIRVELAGTRMLGDLLVHQRLGDHRFVSFVVAQLAEADQVDHHVAPELLAEIQRQLGHESHRFGSSPLTWKIGASTILKISVQ